jgi:hypothetical protein
MCGSRFRPGAKCSIPSLNRIRPQETTGEHGFLGVILCSGIGVLCMLLNSALAKRKRCTWVMKLHVWHTLPQSTCLHAAGLLLALQYAWQVALHRLPGLDAAAQLLGLFELSSDQPAAQFVPGDRNLFLRGSAHAWGGCWSVCSQGGVPRKLLVVSRKMDSDSICFSIVAVASS